MANLSNSSLKNMRMMIRKKKNLCSKYCHCTFLTLIIICVLLVIITYFILLGIWIYGTKITTETLIDGLMTNQEYLSVSDEVQKLFKSSDMLRDLVTISLNSEELTLDFAGK